MVFNHLICFPPFGAFAPPHSLPGQQKWALHFLPLFSPGWAQSKTLQGSVCFKNKHLAAGQGKGTQTALGGSQGLEMLEGALPELKPRPEQVIRSFHWRGRGQILS